MFQQSLEYLYVKNASNINHNLKLSELKRLKALHFYKRLNRDKIAYLLQERKTLNRVESFKIFHAGIEICSIEQVSNLYLDYDMSTYTLIDNYDKLDEALAWIRELSISNTQLNSISNRTLDKFHTRFYNINEISIQEAIDQTNFIQFLKHHPNLKHLFLYNTLLDQTFFDLLSTLCPRLFGIEIINIIY